MDIRKVTTKYGRLVVFLRRDFAEIWGFRYGLTLAIGTLKVMASTGVFVRVFCALRHSIKNRPQMAHETQFSEIKGPWWPL
jgi:hypothetical protein